MVGGLSNSQTMRLRYPDEYKCEVVITKFNKDARSGRISLDLQIQILSVEMQ